jgi:hypothetical protein
LVDRRRRLWQLKASRPSLLRRAVHSQISELLCASGEKIQNAGSMTHAYTIIKCSHHTTMVFTIVP